MTDEKPINDPQIVVQSSTKKQRNKAKKAVSARVETRRGGSRLPGEIWEDSNPEYAPGFIWSLKALPAVRRENRPKFDTVYKRKLMCLYWLQGDLERDGYFTVYGIVKYYALKDNTWADKYFTRLIHEGWIIAVDTHLAKHRRAILSPLFYSLIRAITNTLRREYPERFAPEAIAPEVDAIRPSQSCFDIVQDIPDMR